MTYANLTTSQRNEALRDIRRFWMMRNSQLLKAHMEQHNPLERDLALRAADHYTNLIAGYREALHMINGDSYFAWKF